MFCLHHCRRARSRAEADQGRERAATMSAAIAGADGRQVETAIGTASATTTGHEKDKAGAEAGVNSSSHPLAPESNSVLLFPADGPGKPLAQAKSNAPDGGARFGGAAAGIAGLTDGTLDPTRADGILTPSRVQPAGVPADEEAYCSLARGAAEAGGPSSTPATYACAYPPADASMDIADDMRSPLNAASPAAAGAGVDGAMPPGGVPPAPSLGLETAITVDTLSSAASESAAMCAEEAPGRGAGLGNAVAETCTSAGVAMRDLTIVDGNPEPDEAGNASPCEWPACTHACMAGSWHDKCSTGCWAVAESCLMLNALRLYVWACGTA
jgi:hypothetical protein